MQKGESPVSKNITAHTKLYAILGSPIDHSKSPEMYNYTFKKNGDDSVYVGFDVEENSIKKAFDAFKKLNGFAGGNITMPNKQAAFKYSDELTKEARLIGAVNTFKIEQGKVIGHNTDGRGFVKDLKAHGFDFKGKKAVIVGAGGASEAITVQVLFEGLEELSLFNKTFAKGQQLVDKLKTNFPNQVITANDLVDSQLFKEEVHDADVLINATNVGMEPNVNQSIVTDLSVFHKNLYVVDIIYEPNETRLLKEAKKAGVVCAMNGLGMLFYQGVEAYEYFTGKQMPVEDVKKEVYKI